MHFGNLTTNRVESQHAALKKYLGSSQGDLVNNLKMTHNLLVSQHVSIRASFQRSLSYNMHDHRIPDFNYLRGFVSCHALEKILEEKKRGEYVGIDESKCGCVLKQTHGLPCAHEVVQWKYEGHGIPLSCINPRWKQLRDILINISPNPIDCEREISLFRKRFDGASEDKKRVMLKLLLDLRNPTSTNLEPPSKNNVVRGRPNITKKKTSQKEKYNTKSDLSLFEFAKTGEEQQNTIRKRQAKEQRKETTLKRQIKKLGTMASSKRKKTLPLGELTYEKYFDSVLEIFDPKIKEHIIERLDNVVPDGHSGYKCYAEFLGLSLHDEWKIFRQRMLLELRVHRELHMGMLGGEKHYSDVETALNYFGTYGVFKKYWMQFPAMGCLFATAFNCILCILSPKQYMTYLPLRLGPVDEIKIVQIVLYDDNHFLKLYSKQGAPIPHIVPGWHNHRYPDADI